jgi:hypothetical protein
MVYACAYCPLSEKENIRTRDGFQGTLPLLLGAAGCVRVLK